MLHGNLSTRPFYHERAVHVRLWVVGLLAGIVRVAGGLEVTSLTRDRTTLMSVAERDEDTAQAIAAEAVSLRRQLGDSDLDRVVAATSEANWLIDQRVFSWTAFFNHIEETLPEDVMLTSVRPDVHEDVMSVAIGVIGQGVPDIDDFIAELEATGAFAEVLALEEEVTDEGTYRTLLVGQYLPTDGGAEGAVEDQEVVQ